MKQKTRHGAMEMSVGTIVTIVLLMTVLVLGIILVTNIFKGGNNAVSQVNAAVQNQINKLFSTSGGNLQIYPATQTINIKRGDSTAYGFQFAVKNPDNNPATFHYAANATSMHNCGSTLTLSEADGYIVNGNGPLTAEPGSVSENQVVLFQAPSTAPACIITYTLTVTEPGTSFLASKQMFVTLQ